MLQIMDSSFNQLSFVSCFNVSKVSRLCFTFAPDPSQGTWTEFSARLNKGRVNHAMTIYGGKFLGCWR